ncbi:hypothetical protein KDA_67070 [Dictyobacter alpinus]|uniref:histidine kinase n=1 Tax=Dictyobacter alpinus TaxID=2014873 RepID=A0A402BIL7_9CHLR|nr:PAS domain S-box protein [Dictyobacter alpinus]GCE31223.1 hypothetical protein KDA_67070 [Dictyobacter alpinus]
MHHQRKGLGQKQEIEGYIMSHDRPILHHISSAKSFSLLETLPDAVIYLDKRGIILHASTQAATMLGVSKHKLIGTTLWQHLSDFLTIPFQQMLNTALHAQEPFEVECLSPITHTWLLTRCLPISEDLAFNICTYHLACTPFWTEKVAGKLLTHIPTWFAALEMHQQLRPADAHIEQNGTVPFEAIIRLQADAYRAFAPTLMLPHANHKKVELHADKGDDMTGHTPIRAEVNALIEAIPHLAWIARPDGAVVFSNQRWRDYLAMTCQQAYGQGWKESLHPDDLQQTQNMWQEASKTGSSYEVVYRLQNGQTSDYRWFLARANPMYDEHGQITQWLGTNTDINEQKCAEEALRQSQERLHSLMNSNAIGIFCAEGDEIREANETFLHMTGYSQEDLRLGRLNWFRLTAPEYLGTTRLVQQQLSLHEHITPYEKEYICKDGSRLPVIVGGVLIQRETFQTICFVLNNSPYKALEHFKNNFFSVASQELRTPLTSLKLQTQMLSKRLTSQKAYKADIALSRMEGQLNTVIRLVEELLDLTKIQAGKLEYIQETMDLNEILLETISILQKTWTSHIISMSAPATSIFFVGDRNRLEQVFLNLLTNAICYSPDANQIEIDLAVAAEDIIISVRDHGVGIPQEYQTKIFESFYRLIPHHVQAYPGLGIGLAIALEIVKYYGGAITVESQVGVGSCFQVTLPRNRS